MKIMIVDSDRLFARLMKSKLEKWGHNVQIERNGLAAYERIRKDPFRMVILDWELEGLSGPELCRKIRALKRARYTYIIFYTAKTDKDSLMAGLEAGADDYLTKPLNTLELRLRMKNGKRLLNLEDELREGAGTDKVTGVVNAASFREFFRVIVSEARRTGMKGALMYICVHNYRQVFAEHGYNPAQNLMAEVAKLLVRVTRSSDLVSRQNDDTFCVMLQNTYWDKCVPVSDKILTQARNQAVYVDDVEIHPDLSIELVNYPVEDMDPAQMLDEAPRIAFETVREASSRAVASSA